MPEQKSRQGQPRRIGRGLEAGLNAAGGREPKIWPSWRLLALAFSALKGLGDACKEDVGPEPSSEAMLSPKIAWTGVVV